MENNNKEGFKRSNLEEKICEVMGLDSITPIVSRQINRFILDYDMSFKEIARCIVWYVEVFKGNLNPVYGISFVPNVRQEAAKYFKKLELDQQNQTIEAKKIVEYQDNNIIFNIKSLKHKKRKPRQLDIRDINVKGEDTNEQ